MMSEPTLYREHFTDENEVELGKEGWIYAGTDDEFGVLDRWMVPVEPDDYLTITDDNWRTQYLDHSNELEPGRYAVIRIVDAGAGIGVDDERQPVDVPGLPPVEKCPYCDQCRPMGLRGCLGHYPSGAGIGDET